MIFATEGYVFFFAIFEANLLNTSHGHKVSHFDWNFPSLLHAGLESVEGLLVSPDGPSKFIRCIVVVVVGRLGVQIQAK